MTNGTNGPLLVHEQTERVDAVHEAMKPRDQDAWLRMIGLAMFVALMFNGLALWVIARAVNVLAGLSE